MADEPDALERLNKRLYSTGDLPEFALPQLKPKAPQSAQPAAWVQDAPPPPKKPGMPWSSKFLIAAIAFFILAGGIAAAIFFFGARTVSSDNVTIVPQGPVSIGSGDTVSLLITVRNNNPSAITGTLVKVDLPEGTRHAADTTLPLDDYTDTLGDIAPGGEASRTVNAVLFGAQNQALSIPIRVEFRAEGSNSVFVVEEEYLVTVTSSPLSLTISGAAEAASGEPFTLSVRLRSNAATPLENVAVRVDYPFGFTPTNTNPRPQQGSVFGFGTLTPGEERTISITGVLNGSAADERYFRFAAGTLDRGGTEIALPYAATDQLVRIAAPFLATTLAINGMTDEIVDAEPGKNVSGLISWKNNLAVPVTDAQISISFSGNGFDPSAVRTQSGFYRSSDATILYSKDTNRDLAQLQPGAAGTGSFSFTPKSAAQLAGIPNPTVTMTVSIAGNRITQDQVPERITSTITKTVRIGTNINLSSRAVRSVGPFANTGPVPPRPNTETTYTIELTARNSVNGVGGATATMVLPSYVRYTGSAQPADGSITYDERTRSITWRAGDLGAGQTKQAYFQVALLPSISQSGTSPVLVGKQTLTAIDRFTQQELTAEDEAITIQTTTDPVYQGNHGRVAPQ